MVQCTAVQADQDLTSCNDSSLLLLLLLPYPVAWVLQHARTVMLPKV